MFRNFNLNSMRWWYRQSKNDEKLRQKKRTQMTEPRRNHSSFQMNMHGLFIHWSNKGAQQILNKQYRENLGKRNQFSTEEKSEEAWSTHTLQQSYILIETASTKTKYTSAASIEKQIYQFVSFQVKMKWTALVHVSNVGSTLMSIRGMTNTPGQLWQVEKKYAIN
jgi:hypothetical protein